jgi:glycosyltransferase involved in cell wall biosynthesis
MSTEKPLRILHILGGLNRGGVETWLLHVLRNIDRGRYQMDFLVHTTAPCAYDEEIRSLGSEIIPCLHPSQPLRYARSFKRICRKYGPYDVVHSHVHFFNGMTLWLAAQMGVRGRIAHMYPLRDTRPQNLRRAAYRTLVTRMIARYATIILSDSHNSLAAFQSICDCRHLPSMPLYCGIDQSPFQRRVDRAEVRRSLELPLDKPVITFVARLSPHKNHAQLVRVADRLNADGHRYHFVIAGSHGELLEHYQKVVADRPYISMLTGVKDISGLLLASDLFFFPSLEEGFGIVAVEASAAGLPIVATNLPTIQEACAPSHHAFMFPPDDDEIATRHIRTILTDRSLRESLSADAREWAPRYSVGHSVDKLMAVYNRYRPAVPEQRERALAQSSR